MRCAGGGGCAGCRGEAVETLLDEDSVGGLLKRIAAIARALGAVPRETELVEVQPALWAIEDLAHDAQARLRAALLGAGPAAAIRERPRGELEGEGNAGGPPAGEPPPRRGMPAAGDAGGKVRAGEQACGEGEG